MVIQRTIDDLVHKRRYLLQVTACNDDLEKSHNWADWQCFKLLEDSVVRLAQSQLPRHVQRPVWLAVIINDMLTGIWRDPCILDSRKRQCLRALGCLLGAKEGVEEEMVSAEELPLDATGRHLWHADFVLSQVRDLERTFRDVLGEGVTRTVDLMLRQLDRPEITTMAEYNLHCHTLDGMLHITLARIFATGGIECPYLGNGEHLCNALGLVGAKTREILNLRPNAKLGVATWPREVWGLYAVDEVDDFLRPEKRRAFGYCLNHMVFDALQHLPDVDLFLSRLEDPTVFRLFAIEQMLSIKTLCRMYGCGEVEMLQTRRVREDEVAVTYGELIGLSDFRRMLREELQRVRHQLGAHDPISGPVRSFLARMEAIGGRTRNRSFLLMPRTLTLGSVIELCLMAVVGFLIVCIRDHAYVYYK